MKASERLTAKNVLGSLTLQTPGRQLTLRVLLGFGNNLLVELCSQCLDDLAPVCVGRQAPSWGAPNAVSTVELHMKRVEDMAARADRDANTVSECRIVWRRGAWRRLHLGFVKLKTNLRKVVQLGDSASLDLSLNASLDDTVE